MPLQLENRWSENTHHYVRWSENSRQVIRLYKPRLQQQLVLSPRCGHLKGNGGVKGAVRFAQRLTNQYAYVARFDIRHYYESTDHRVMLAQCRHVSPDVFDVVQDYLCVPDRRGTGKGMVAGGRDLALDGRLVSHAAGSGDGGSVQEELDSLPTLHGRLRDLRQDPQQTQGGNQADVCRSRHPATHRPPGQTLHPKTEKGFDFLGYRFRPQKLLEPAVQSLTRLIERAHRLHEKGADSHRLRQYVQRWVTWLHGGLHGAVTENRFNQIWNYVNQQLKI